MTRTRRRAMRGDHGAQAVEFALIVPVVLLIIFAIIQFGFAFNTQVTVTQAAREGARLAAICRNTCTPKTVLQATQDAAPGIKTSDLTIIIKYCPADGSACTGSAGSPGYCPTTATQATGDAVVIVTAPSPIEGLLPFDLTLHGKAHMPCGG